MSVDLYTLPICPICKMIKTKLENKNIFYAEHPFEECQKFVKTDRAPVMAVCSDIDLTTNIPSADVKVILSPKEMNDWINNYKEE